jgi:4-diphosphocytidyl-2-C-methyl-D-erythritol kinase
MPSESRSLTVAAHAKLNLRLKIEGVRDDGYHLLSMLNATIELHDEIRLCKSERGVTIASSGPAAGSDPALSDASKNLAGRAAAAFLSAFGVSTGLRVEITKHIPLGAGLGGGSSDAAAVLRAAVRMFPDEFEACERRTSKLAELALALGADVPYFMEGGLATVGGIGEKVRRCTAPALEGYPVLLAVPPFPLSTKEVYAAFDRGAIACARDGELRSFETRSRAFGADALGALVENDLEGAAIACEPRMRELLTLLRAEKGGTGGMTGSGSALFFLPDNRSVLSAARVQAIRESLTSRGANVIQSEILSPDRAGAGD